jgi:7-carboxy-7-deazaguanine synthase
LLCSYCDTLYAVSPKTEEDKANAYTIMSVDEVISTCKFLGNKRITFTGGEPLIQKDARELISKLTLDDFEVNIETNGAVDIRPFKNMDLNQPIAQDKVIFTMDWKSPSSGMREKMIESNLYELNNRDVLKFVVGSKEDLDDMKKVVNEHRLRCEVFVSPVFGKIEPSELVEYIKENNLQNVRVQLQLHKIIWNPNKRGV